MMYIYAYMHYTYIKIMYNVKHIQPKLYTINDIDLNPSTVWYMEMYIKLNAEACTLRLNPGTA